jgi:hypothetical protein
LAYDNGAKYILVFDSNEAHTAGILKDEHLRALQQFWQYTRNNPRKSIPVGSKVAFVLPNGFGDGFRGPDDGIWGLWQADALAQNISTIVGSLLGEYGPKLDIIYDDGLQPGNNYGYSKLLYWNDSSLFPSPSPTPSASPSPTPSDSPAPTISPPTQTPTPTNIETLSLSINYVPVLVAGAVVAAVVVPAFKLRKRQYCITFAQSGIGADFTGTTVVIDGERYDREGASFLWDSGSRHTFKFKSPLVVSRDKQFLKHYVWASTTGLATEQDGILTVSMPSIVAGNYRSLFKIGAPLPTAVTQRLKSANKSL